MNNSIKLKFSKDLDKPWKRFHDELLKSL